MQQREDEMGCFYHLCYQMSEASLILTLSDINKMRSVQLAVKIELLKFTSYTQYEQNIGLLTTYLRKCSTKKSRTVRRAVSEISNL